MKIPATLFTFARLLLCIAAAVGMLYVYIDKQNTLTELRIKVRALAKEVREIQENNIGLQYQVEQFESPVHLMELAKQPAFGHLKYPYIKDIIIIQENGSESANASK